MIRSLVILSVFIVALSHGQYTTERRYYDDFKGQKFCGARRASGEDSCCRDRLDDCSVPIAGTLCYCDEFCDQHINPDCCPDYEPVCLGITPPTPPPERIFQTCFVNDVEFREGEEKQINCNLCKCVRNHARNTIKAECEEDDCLSDTEMIEKINYDGVELGWKSHNYSEFYGKKLKEGLTYRLGTFEPRVRVKSMSRLGHLADQFPRNFDSLRFNEWSDLISEVPDQGWCGSSWAVSTASVASDRISINSKQNTDLSSQNFLSCVRHQQGCTGGHLDNAWRYLNKFGIVDNHCYSYKTAVERCPAKRNINLRTSEVKCEWPAEDQIGAIYKMGPAYSLNNETDIMWEISTYGPVQATMWVYADFFTYRSGIYRKSRVVDQKPKGFHSVRLVGWGEESNGYQTEKYWIAANSWGKWWGESGFFRILRGSNECSIEEYVLAAMADHHDKKSGRAVRSHLKRSNRRSYRKSA